MKIKWSVEGHGCPFAQCGAADFEVEIPDEELEGLTGSARDALIDEWVDDEFKRNIYPHWTILEG